MIKYIVEKNIEDSYAHGVKTLVNENGNIKTFISEEEAIQWLIHNDEEFCSIPVIKIRDYYNIKPYVI